MKRNTLYLLILSTICAFTACSKTSDKKPADETKSEQITSIEQSDNAENARVIQAPSAEAPKADAQAPITATIDEIPGDECTERMCQCGSTACTKGEVCKNGQCFCGSQLANDENYQCRTVNIAPIPSTVEKPVKQYLCQTAEGCKCEGAVGETICPQNSYCIDGGGCGCGSTLINPDNADITSYACNLISESQYDWVCREANGCRCGSITAAVNMGCNGKNATCLGSPVPGRGLACRSKAYQNYKYHLACFKDECDCYGKKIAKDEICEPLVCSSGFSPAPNGCVCGSEIYAEGFECVPGKGGKPVKYCTSSKEDDCTCGETRCMEFEVCKRGECVDRTAMKKQENTTDYTFESGFWKCTNPDGCTCGKPAKNGKSNCENGKYCINSMCRKDTYFRSIDGKVLYYRLADNTTECKGIDCTHSLNDLWDLMFIDENEPICQRNWSGIIQTVNGNRIEFCKNENYKYMSVSEFLKNCGTGSQPDNVGTLYCELSYEYRKDAPGDSNDIDLTVSGWKE